MSNKVTKSLILIFAVLAYFIAYPEDAQAVTVPIATFLSLTTAISPWFYGVVAVGIFSIAMMKTWGGRVAGR